MQHDGALVVLKNISQDHIAVQEGEIAETTSFGGVEGKGGDLKGVQRLWAHPRDVDVLQIHGENTIGSRWWLSSGVPKPDEGMGNFADNDKDPEQGGDEAVGVRIFI